MSELLKDKKILVIDDEAGLRDMLVFGLHEDECQVIPAASGDEAIQQARKTPIDVAICDIMMPGLNGIEVLKALKEIQPEMQVIMATGMATLQSAVDAMKAGAFDYLIKPFDLAQIRLTLATAMQAKNLRTPVLEMADANGNKSEFLTAKGRDLRAPCQELFSDSTELLGGAYGALSQAQTQILRRMETNAQALLRLIECFADLSKSKV